MIEIIQKQVNFFKKLTNLQQDKQETAKSQIIINNQQDTLALEVPVALVYNDISHVVMMTTPTNLEDFALGFSLTEQIIDKPQDIYGIDIIETCNGIEVQIELATRCFVRLKEKRRTLAGRTGCGICGTEQLSQVTQNLPKLHRTLQVEAEIFDDCLQQLHQAQILGKQTGATHASAFFSLEGKLLAIREDVGRHVALDKLLGWYARQQSKSDTKLEGFILTTSRASYEMVQKVGNCKIELLAAISAPTDLAVKMAEDCGMTLLGFVREGKGTIYCGEERILFSSEP